MRLRGLGVVSGVTWEDAVAVGVAPALFQRKGAHGRFPVELSRFRGPNLKAFGEVRTQAQELLPRKTKIEPEPDR